MTFPVRPMLPTLSTHWPVGDNWIYEVKYDGYRGQLLIHDHQDSQLYSRNLKLLNTSFPEIISFLKSNRITHYAPCVLDGEVCILETDTKASFSSIQKRGRLKKKDKIRRCADQTPATFVVFDILMIQGIDLTTETLSIRKKHMEKIKIPKVEKSSYSPIQVVHSSIDPDTLWRDIQESHSEGMVAKNLTSSWQAGQRTTSWLKTKNYQKGVFFITAYDKTNHYFHVGLRHNNAIVTVGLFTHGLTNTERMTLVDVIKKNKNSETTQLIIIQPSICVELNYIEWYHNELRQPRFASFRLDWNWEDCTWEKMRLNK